MLIGYRAIRALDAASAVHALASLDVLPCIGLVSRALPAATDALRAIRLGTGASLHWTLWGARPDPVEAAVLRAEGVRFLLPEPFADEDLRFVLTEALRETHPGTPRAEARVPTPLRARVLAKTGERVASVHNLSSTGAYLATPRPTLRGGTVEVHLALPAGELRLTADVLWNNVPGNLRRPGAPIGMGVRFVDVARDAALALDAYVEERVAAYRL